MSDLSLCPDHLADLRKSGLTDDTIRGSGIRSVPPGDIGKILTPILGWNPPAVTSLLRIPYGDDGYARFKLYPPYKGKDGHTIKYLGPKGLPPRLYAPSQVHPALANPTVPLVIVEGEKKCLAGLQHGLACVAVSGVDAWRSRNGDGTSHPISDLDGITWQGRRVEIVYDNDVILKPDVLRAERRLGEELTRRGATVRAVRLPPGPAKGLDDYLVAHSVAEFHALPRVVVGGALRPHVLALAALLAVVLPARENLCGGWLFRGSLVLVWGWRGIGKTFFILALCLALALGTPFMQWKVPKRRRVLLIDGEMPTSDLQARCRLLAGDQVVEGFDILPSETLWLHDEPLNLNVPEHQARMDALLDALDAEGRLPDVVVFDNLSSLCAGLDENDNSALDGFLRWAIRLRHRGLAVVLVHHAGKGGDQRGASRREDFLDTSIKLSAPSSDEPVPIEGAKFAVEFVKTRARRPRPDYLVAELRTDQHGHATWWCTTGRPQPAYFRVLRALLPGPAATQAEVCKRTGLSKGPVSGHVRKAREKELIEPDRLELTDAGRRAAAPEF
jgi:KaiC/GvpD/RAD55 family RecA-like ATPase